MLIKKIAILGGTGFVGSLLCNRLSKEGFYLKILTRNREYNREDIILLPNAELIEADVNNLNNLNECLRDCDAVINLIGILNEKSNNGDGFKLVHVELIKNLIKACKKNNIRRFIQMSALNADAKNGMSFYLKTKGQAEKLLHTNTIGMKVTSFRPSVIFGKKDSFFNRFSNLLKITPLFFPLACHKTKFAPVYVLDVIEMMINTIGDPASYDKKFNICGPKIYSLKELVAYTAKTIDKKCIIIPLNNILSFIQAKIFDFLPGKPFSTDNYLSAQIDSICKQNDLKIYDIKPTPLEDIVPSYLVKDNYDSFYSDL
ncbi:MAG: epimerase [Legionellales bacterium]|nr:epimerase [Legionellales bacterium]